MTDTFLPISVRLDAETEQRLRRLAHETGGTVSSVVREAIAEYGAAHERRASASVHPYDRLKHLVGVVDRHTHRSESTGKAFRSGIQARARARRSR